MINFYIVYTIVFRPGSIQDPGQFFFFNQNDIILVKKNKSQWVATGFQNYGLHKLLILLFFHTTKKNYEDMNFQFIFKTLFLDYDKFYFFKKKQTTNK
jgi:hypothetical protein